MNKKFIVSNTLVFKNDDFIKKRVITIGKTQYVMLIHNVGTVPMSKKKILGDVAIRFYDYYEKCPSNAKIFVDLNDEASLEGVTCKLFWDIIVKCFGCNEDRFVYDSKSANDTPYRLKIQCLQLESAYQYVDKNKLAILSYEDVPRDRFEFFIPFYRFVFIGNVKVLCLDQIYYSHNPQFLKEFEVIYENEKASEEINDFFYQFFPYYDRVNLILKKTSNSIEKNNKTVYLQKAIDKLKEERESVEKRIDEIKQQTSSRQSVQAELMDLYTSLYEVNDYILVLEEQQTHEAFENNTVSLDITEPLKVNILKQYKDIYRMIELDNYNPPVRLVEKDEVRIRNQKSIELNGNYRVVRVTPRLVLENMQVLSFNESFNIVSTKGDDTGNLMYNVDKELILGVSKTKLQNYNGDIVWFDDLKQRGFVFKNLAIIYKGIEEYRRELEHVCVDHHEINSKNLCEIKGYIWDRRCQSHYDCPFYNTSNGRGGCDNGLCEMPIGVQSVGYTQYIQDNKQGAIYCHRDNDDDNDCMPAFAGDRRAKIEIERFTIETVNTNIKEFLKTRISRNAPIVKNKWIEVNPEEQIMKNAARNLLSDKYKYLRYFNKKKYYKSGDDRYFTLCLVMEDGTLIETSTLYLNSSFYFLTLDVMTYYKSTDNIYLKNVKDLKSDYEMSWTDSYETF